MLREIASRSSTAILWSFLYMVFAVICLSLKLFSFLLALCFGVASIAFMASYMNRMFRYTELYIHGLTPKANFSKIKRARTVVVWCVIALVIPFQQIVWLFIVYMLGKNIVFNTIEIFLRFQVAIVFILLFISIAFHTMFKATKLELFTIARNVFASLVILPIIVMPIYILYNVYAKPMSFWESILLALIVVLSTVLLAKLRIEGKADELFEKVGKRSLDSS